MFTYNEDTDLLNKNYTSNNKKIYGQYEYIIDKKYTDTYNIKLNFAPTPVARFNNLNMYVPSLNFNKDGSLSIDRDALSKPRILFYNGTKASTGWSLKSNQTTSAMTYYPFTSHFEELDGQTNDDLCFDSCDNYFFGITNPTERNLVNVYYDRYIRELLDVNARKVSCYVYLNEFDIHNFNFNNKIEIEGIYYRVLSIEKYNPYKLTKVNLIKINEVSLNIPYRRKLPIGVLNPVRGIVDLGHENISNSTGIILGDNNNVREGISNIFISGNNNIATANNSFIFGDNIIAEENSFNIATTNITLSAETLRVVLPNLIGDQLLIVGSDGTTTLTKSTKIHIIDGNYDQYNEVVNIHIIEDAKNEVRGSNSINTIKIIDELA